jgi:hypothetical protein
LSARPLRNRSSNPLNERDVIASGLAQTSIPWLTIKFRPRHGDLVTTAMKFA